MTAATAQPTDAGIALELGRAKPHWDRLLTEAARTIPGAAVEWKHYSGKTGWRLVVRHKGRNLAYLKHSKGGFLISLALSDKALDAAAYAGIPSKVLGPIRSSPKYPEGRAARIEVTSAATVALALKFIAVKAAN